VRKRLSSAARREVIEVGATEVFAESGYRGASMQEIARRSGVTVPVLYDHFSSKTDLHRRLLERTRDELLDMWREHLFSDEPAEVRIPASLEAWARYVESNPYAARMFFRETSGDSEAGMAHREVQDQARAALTQILGREPGIANIAGSEPLAVEMAAETIRSGLTGLAIWWGDHPEVPREQIVTTAINVVWIGFERVRRGEGWGGSTA